MSAEAWLPALPQLGGKLSYEKYYGDDVALFGKDKRQHNPSAVTAGINYTPFPLLTLGAEHRQANAGNKDSRINLQLNYQLFVPWHQQLNSDAVSSLRSLAGSRYDLVNRNNNIILEYRKKEVIRLFTAELLTGYAGEKKSLNVAINSKYDLDRIDWSASALIAAGGQLIHENAGSYHVVLPDYQSAPDSVNTYTVSGVAVDKKGNTSSKATTQVTVMQAAVSVDKSTFTASASTLPADGKSQIQLVLKVNDRDGAAVDLSESEISLNLVSGNAVEYSVSKGKKGKDVALSAVTRQSPGTYVMTLTAGTLPGVVTITPFARNTRFASAAITLLPDNSTAIVQSMEVITNNATADGKAQNTVKIIVVDAHGNTVPVQPVTFKASHAAIVSSPLTTNAQGEILVPVTSTRSGEAILTAGVDDKNVKDISLTFSPDKTTSLIQFDNLTIIPEISLADGQTEKTVIAVVTDANGNPVPDVEVRFSADNAAQFTGPAKSTTNSQGQVVTTLISKVAGVSKVTATVNQQPQVRETQFTGNTATALVAALTPAAGPYLADGKTSVVFSAQITDQQGNPLSGVPVDWKSDRDSTKVKFSERQNKTNDKGVATVAISSTQAYGVTVTASTNAHSLDAVAVMFEADKTTARPESLTISPAVAVADGVAEKTATARVVDVNGNPVPGIEVAFSADNAAQFPGKARAITDAQGQALSTLTSTVAGMTKVTVSVNKLTLDQNTEFTANAGTAQVVSVTPVGSGPYVADGRTGVVFSARISDLHGNLLAGVPVDWSANQDKNKVLFNEGQTFTDDRGVATVTVTSTLAALVEVTASAHADAKAAPAITFVANKATARIAAKDLSAKPALSAADGKTGKTVMAVVTDANDNPVADIEVAFSAGNSALFKGKGPVTTNAQGQAISTLTSTVAGHSKITATVNKVPQTHDTEFTADASTAQVATVTPAAGTYIADGKSGVIFSALVTDKHGNPLKGIRVDWASDKDNSQVAFDKSQSVTNDRGVATTSLTSIRAYAVVVTATAGSSTVKAQAITFKANNATAQVKSVSPAGGPYVAGKTHLKYSALVVDANDNVLSGVPVSWKSDKDATQVAFSAQQSFTNANGVAEITITSTQAYTVVVTATAHSSSREAGGVRFVADAGSPMVSMIESDKSTLVANGVDAASIKIRVVDTFNNPLDKVKVKFQFIKGEGAIAPLQPETDKDGYARVTLTTQRAGGDIQLEAGVDNGRKKGVVQLKAIADRSTAAVKVSASDSTAVVGSSGVLIKAMVVDKHNNVLTNMNVAWSSDSNTPAASISTTDEHGVATMRLTGTKSVKTQARAALANGAADTVEIEFTPGSAETNNSELAMSPQSLVADDKSTSVATLILRDKFDNLVPGQSVRWSSQEKSIKFSDESEVSKGIYQARVRGSKQGAWMLNASSGGVDKAATLGLLADKSTAIIKKVVVTGKDRAKADGKDIITLRATVEDSQGNSAIKGVSVGWRISPHGNLAAPLSATNDKGEAEITLTSAQAGEVTVSALLGGGQAVTADKKVIFIAGDVSAKKSALSISPFVIIADTAQQATVTLTVKDGEGNLLSGLKSNSFTLNYSTDLSMVVSAFKETSAGVYEAQITGKKAGVTEVLATVAGTQISQKGDLELRADNSSVKVKGAITATPPMAATGAYVTYEATLVDKNENPLGEGIPVTWLAGEGTVFKDNPVTYTDKFGVTRVVLTRTSVGTAVLNAVLSNKTTVAAPDVVFSAGDPDEKSSVITLAPARIIAGLETAKLTVLLKDQHGNPLSGQAVKAMSNNPAMVVGKSVGSQAGVYVMDVAGKVAGTATLSVEVNAKKYSATKVLTVIGDVSNWRIAGQKLPAKQMTAGDAKGITYQATVSDIHGNRLKDVIVSWQLKGQALDFEPITRTNEQGVATSTVRSNTVGTLAMSAHIDDQQKYKFEDVQVVSSEVDPKKSEFRTDKSTIGSDGKEVATLTVTLSDSHGNRISGKKVSIERVKDLQGVSITTMVDKTNGVYQASLTGSSKGAVSIAAKVDGKTIGSNIDIKVSAITPDLQFGYARHQVTYQSRFAGAQPVVNAPAGVAKMWSSSAPEVASIDAASGTITLNKSGVATITVQSGGNAEYNPASASYVLQVDKADPQLTSGTTAVESTWADGKTYQLVAIYKNADAASQLKPEFESLSGSVVTVAPDGTLNGLKPGSANLRIQSKETDRFKAASVSVSWLQHKAVPILSFSNESVNEPYRSQSFNSQHVNGVPAGIKPSWSSSATDVASIIPASGVITLKKSGIVTITASTPGNDFYSASTKSYYLTVDKADPGLVYTGTAINATWEDGKDYWLGAVSFTHADVAATLRPTIKYISNQPGVVSVGESSGKLQAVKPGVATVEIKSEETDKFRSAKASVVYTLGKRTIPIRFASSLVKVSKGPGAGRREFESWNALSSAAKAATSWVSSDPSVFDLSSNSLNAGRTRVTATVAANDYYNQSSGYYDLEVYDVMAKILRITRTSNTTTHTTGDWKPSLENDSISVTWSMNIPNGYAKPQYVAAELRDATGALLGRESLNSSEFVSGEHTRTFPAQTRFWKRDVYLQVVAKDQLSYETKRDSEKVRVVKESPKDIWEGNPAVETRVAFYITATGAEQTTCRVHSGILGRQHHATVAHSKQYFGFKGRLLAPMKIKQSFNGISIFDDNIQSSFTVAEDYWTVDRDCWRDSSSGQYSFTMDIEYGGDTYSYKTPSVGWNGSSVGKHSTSVFE